jgi:mxaJ protein
MQHRQFASLILGIVLAAQSFSSGSGARELRVCADPNNLPFSNHRHEGFENKIAELIAKDLGAELRYTWWPQRRGFIRNTLNEGLCDLVPGTARGMEMLRTTQAYYRSGFVFVTRIDGPKVSTLDDPVLGKLAIGVQLIGEDGSNPPPAHSLAQRGIIDNVRGYPVYGDYRNPSPSASVVSAVASGEVDVGIIWGPLAGFFAARETVPLRLQFVAPQIDGPRLPMAFDIAMGVRQDDRELHEEISDALVRLRPMIDRILLEYGVPRVDQEFLAVPALR